MFLTVLVWPACTTTDAPRHPRPALASATATVAIQPPELEELHEFDDGRATGVLRGHEEQVHFEVRRAHRDERPELVLLVPILAGGRELMGMVADRLVGEGFDVAFCERAGSALSPPQRGPELDELFRRTVLHQRLLLAWLRHREAAPRATHVLGISMGGIVATVVAAQEPDLDGVAVCLAGADLARMVLETSESRVRRWLSWRQTTDGIAGGALQWELQQWLSHEPARFAPAVATDKVLFISAALDTVVPRRNQNVLWEALGRPRRLDMPLGHYSAVVAVDAVIHAAARHFRARAPMAPE